MDLQTQQLHITYAYIHTYYIVQNSGGEKLRHIWQIQCHSTVVCWIKTDLTSVTDVFDLRKLKFGSDYSVKPTSNMETKMRHSGHVCTKY